MEEETCWCGYSCDGSCMLEDQSSGMENEEVCQCGLTGCSYSCMTYGVTILARHLLMMAAAETARASDEKQRLRYGAALRALFTGSVYEDNPVQAQKVAAALVRADGLPF